jgi:serine/threonine-protein kinase PknG
MSDCTQVGCTGSIVDGYCTVCGLAAAPAAAGTGHAGRAEGMASGPTGSGGTAPGRTSSGRTSSGRSTRTGSASGTSRRGMLGAGLVEVPAVPYRDPATAILPSPEVPEHNRICSSCGRPVGRSRDGRPGRPEGFCPACGARFSFTPKLAHGDVVGGQYEVLGCLAHGGLGWIYLAQDRNVSDRWVVLKGLLDTGDADAMSAALAERQFLARVEHPNIVKIYNFVQHPSTRTPVGYIVMEYVGGQSLKDMMLARRRADGRLEPIPLGQAIAYALEGLRALGYLHSLGLVYCDFKPDNVIQSEEQLKLIDLGGVRRIDDQTSAIYGTVGYQAPEIGADGPSISSDLYTVARALAVLTFDFRGYTGKYAARLPGRAEVPLLRRHESYDRVLRRATDPEPDRRFGSAAEMAEQLTGVLREVLAEEDGQPRPAVSGIFGPEVRAVGADIAGALVVPAATYSPPDPAAAAAGLPVPLVDASDPAAGYLAGLSAARPAEITVLLAQPPVASPEVSLRLARAYIELADWDRAVRVLDYPATADWRVDWYQALAELARGRPASAAFDAIYSLLPGEVAPKLALALSAELEGDLPAAARYYQLVWTTDQSYATAAFGLARVRLALGERAAAVRALDSVPASAAHYIQAQVAGIAARIRGRVAGEMDPADVLEAGSRLEALGLDAEHRKRLEAEVLEAALASLGRPPGLRAGGAANGSGGGVPAGNATLPAGNAAGPAGNAAGPAGNAAGPAGNAAGPAGNAGVTVGPAGQILGLELSERQLRIGLERAYRALAHLAQDAGDRIALVDRANSVRPRTLL